MTLDREQKKIKENYTAHSQGSLILGNALNLVVKNGKAEILKGKKIHMNGSPGSMKVMEKFAKEHGIEFTYKVNVGDPVTYLGKNSSNSTNSGHTGKKNNENKGYNKYQEYNNEIKKYEVNSDKYKKIHLISNTRYIEGDK